MSGGLEAWRLEEFHKTREHHLLVYILTVTFTKMYACESTHSIV